MVNSTSTNLATFLQYTGCIWYALLNNTQYQWSSLTKLNYVLSVSVLFLLVSSYHKSVSLINYGFYTDIFQEPFVIIIWSNLDHTGLYPNWKLWNVWGSGKAFYKPFEQFRFNWKSIFISLIILFKSAYLQIYRRIFCLKCRTRGLSGVSWFAFVDVTSHVSVYFLYKLKPMRSRNFHM